MSEAEPQPQPYVSPEELADPANREFLPKDTWTALNPGEHEYLTGFNEALKDYNLMGGIVACVSDGHGSRLYLVDKGPEKFQQKLELVPIMPAASGQNPYEEALDRSLRTQYLLTTDPALELGHERAQGAGFKAHIYDPPAEYPVWPLVAGHPLQSESVGIEFKVEEGTVFVRDTSDSTEPLIITRGYAIDSQYWDTVAVPSDLVADMESTQLIENTQPVPPGWQPH